MKKFLFTVTTLLLFAGITYARGKHKIPDGLYLIVRIDTVAATAPLPAHTTVVHFSKLFDDYNKDELRSSIVIDTKEYVPLELEKAPATEQQTEAKKKLLLSLTPAASEKLKSFTAKHVMSMVALVVDGEVLTKHKIKEAITSGQLQISRCNDNACERLYVQLKDNVKEK